MSREESEHALYRKAWQHIDQQEFAQAEPLLRSLLEITDPTDPARLWQLYGLLAEVLNSLARPSEGTEMYRHALREAERAGDASSTVGPARFMLANQHLAFGDPRDALAVAEPVPSGVGHIQCLLHSVAAQALSKLGRSDDARATARRALDAAPTAERRAALTADLAHLLGAG